jgi:quercetin dioxygenase-like cupin family protein
MAAARLVLGLARASGGAFRSHSGSRAVPRPAVADRRRRSHQCCRKKARWAVVRDGILVSIEEFAMSTRTLALAVLLTAATALSAEGQAGKKEKPKESSSQRKLEWGPAPAALPAGARMAVVSGDPGKAAPFTVMLEMPPGYLVPPHRHPTDEHISVRSGQFRYGMADRIDEKATKSLRPGQSVNLPANMNHYAMTRGRTVIAISSTGPFAITYVNPADDPQKMKP